MRSQLLSRSRHRKPTMAKAGRLVSGRIVAALQRSRAAEKGRSRQQKATLKIPRQRQAIAAAR